MKPALILLATASFALAQGDLAPPGPPAASMKTLAQIEPRTDVLTLAGDANVMNIISAPGSYFLSGNLTAAGIKSGFRITASNVTLDLGGFLIAGGGGTSSAGIEMVGTLKGITVTNGSITGFFNSIMETGSLKDSRISFLNASAAMNFGINLGTEPTNSVEHCAVRDGFLCIMAGQVHHCTAFTSAGGQGAISASATVTHSSGIATAANTVGISAGSGNPVPGGPPASVPIGGTVINCRGEGGETGIRSVSVTDSVGISKTGGYGIDASDNVHNCSGDATLGGGVGIYAGGNVSLSKGAGRDGKGIRAGGNVDSSTGKGVDIADGIYADGNVQNSTGLAGDGKGITAGGSVTNSSGYTNPYLLPASSGTGIKAKIISFSQGTTPAGGKGLDCTTAVGCVSTGGDTITNKYQMP